MFHSKFIVGLFAGTLALSSLSASANTSLENRYMAHTRFGFCMTRNPSSEGYLEILYRIKDHSFLIFPRKDKYSGIRNMLKQMGKPNLQKPVIRNIRCTDDRHFTENGKPLTAKQFKQVFVESEKMVNLTQKKMLEQQCSDMDSPVALEACYMNTLREWTSETDPFGHTPF